MRPVASAGDKLRICRLHLITRSRGFLSGQTSAHSWLMQSMDNAVWQMLLCSYYFSTLPSLLHPRTGFLPHRQHLVPDGKLLLEVSQHANAMCTKYCLHAFGGVMISLTFDMRKPRSGLMMYWAAYPTPIGSGLLKHCCGHKKTERRQSTGALCGCRAS